MADSFGPPIIDWSPIASLGKTFLGAYDQAARRRQEAEARGPIDRTMASMGQGALPQEMRSIASLGELPAQQPMQSKAPTFAAMEGAEPSRTLEGMFGERERQYALPAGYLSQTAAIESQFNPNAQNPNSSAGGLFQFTDGTAKQYGLSNKFDPAASTDAAARLAADNRAYLSKALGREPTAHELYLAHQQGAGSAAKLLSNPNARAADVLGAKAVALNGGNETMTAGEFAQKWMAKIGGGNPADLPAQGSRNAQFMIPEGGRDAHRRAGCGAACQGFGGSGLECRDDPANERQA
ncbi:transglycosylase SLT domain-containing protein [Microvirga sp. TS319]|uniref:transglycosylase SLT domain-containing protein n=1 Tax=Microvirga sp. TS319 TaxID=3241165 RepID=UPI003519DDF0